MLFIHVFKYKDINNNSLYFQIQKKKKNSVLPFFIFSDLKMEIQKLCQEMVYGYKQYCSQNTDRDIGKGRDTYLS